MKGISFLRRHVILRLQTVGTVFALLVHWKAAMAPESNRSTYPIDSLDEVIGMCSGPEMLMNVPSSDDSLGYDPRSIPTGSHIS